MLLNPAFILKYEIIYHLLKFVFRFIEEICISIFFILILALTGSLNHLSWAWIIAWFSIKFSNELKSNLLSVPLALTIVLPVIVFKAYNLGEIK